MLALAVVACGLLAVVGGVLWKSLAPVSLVWTDEQAAELAAADVARHAAQSGAHDHAGHDHGASDSGDQTPGRAAAEERFNRLRGELDAARQLRDDLGLRLIQIGFALTAAGGLGYLATQRHP